MRGVERRIIFPDKGQKKFRISLREPRKRIKTEKMKKSTKEYTRVCYSGSVEFERKAEPPAVPLLVWSVRRLEQG